MPEFDGHVHPDDVPRLRTQLERVRGLMDGGKNWWTLRQLTEWCGGSEASISARIRDLRKEKHGAHVIEKKRMPGGVWKYRMKAKPKAQGSLFETGLPEWEA